MQRVRRWKRSRNAAQARAASSEAARSAATPRSRFSRGFTAAGALVGLAGGLLGLYTFVRTEFPDISLSARHAGAQDPHVIRIGVVNSSPRAASVVDGTVRWNGYEVGHVVAVNSDPVESSAADVRSVSATATPLPFAIQGGATFSGAVVWDEGDSWNPQVVNAFRKTITGPRGGDHRPSGRIEVALELKPGGKRTATIELPVGDGFSASGGNAAGWHTSPLLDRDSRVRGLQVGVSLREPTVAELAVWPQGSQRPIRELTLPITQQRPARFWTGRLPDGTYRWVLSSGGAIVAADVYRTPCDLPDERAATEPCEMEVGEFR